MTLHHILGATVDDTPVNEIDEGVAEHFGVHSEVVLFCQQGQKGAWDLANSGLDAASIRNKFGDVLCDAVADLIDFACVMLQHRPFAPHHAGNVINVDECVAEGAGHVGVDLGNDLFGNSAGSQSDINADPKRAVAMLVWGRDADHRYVDWHLSLQKEMGDLAEEDRDVVGSALVHVGSCVARHEEGFVPHAFAGHVGCPAEGEEVNNLDLLQIVASAEGVGQNDRLATVGSDVDPVARFDQLDCFKCGRVLELLCHERYVQSRMTSRTPGIWRRTLATSSTSARTSAGLHVFGVCHTIQYDLFSASMGLLFCHDFLLRPKA